MGRGNFGDVDIELLASIEPGSDDNDDHKRRGEVLARQGKTDAAIAEFRAALRLKPWDCDGHKRLGDALASQGKIDEASDEYVQAKCLGQKPTPGSAGSKPLDESTIGPARARGIWINPRFEVSIPISDAEERAALFRASSVLAAPDRPTATEAPNGGIEDRQAIPK